MPLFGVASLALSVRLLALARAAKSIFRQLLAIYAQIGTWIREDRRKSLS